MSRRKKDYKYDLSDAAYAIPEVLGIVTGYIDERYGLSASGLEIIAPFSPGEDYRSIDYNSKVIIDIAPFSVLRYVLQDLTKLGAKYFLFAQAMTTLQVANGIEGACAVICGANVTYYTKDGTVKKMKTNFITNLEPENMLVTMPELRGFIEYIEDQKRSNKRPFYVYPKGVFTAAALDKWVRAGMEFSIPRGKAIFKRALDGQKEIGKEAFGGCLMLSNSAWQGFNRASKKVYDYFDVPKNKLLSAKVFELSDEEKAMIKKMDADTADD